jgi:hypothetical protein
MVSAFTFSGVLFCSLPTIGPLLKLRGSTTTMTPPGAPNLEADESLRPLGNAPAGIVKEDVSSFVSS